MFHGSATGRRRADTLADTRVTDSERSPCLPTARQEHGAGVEVAALGHAIALSATSAAAVASL